MAKIMVDEELPAVDPDGELYRSVTKALSQFDPRSYNHPPQRRRPFPKYIPPAEKQCHVTGRHPPCPAHDMDKSRVKDTLCGQSGSVWDRILKVVACWREVLRRRSKKEAVAGS